MKFESWPGQRDHTRLDAMHPMRNLIDMTSNIAAVQRQLGHTNPAYSIQYARITNQELGDILNDR